MNYYFVDYENVSVSILNNVSKIKNGDCIHIFYGNNPSPIPIFFLEEIKQKGIQFTIHKAVTGTKNALDFQLSSYLGYIIGKLSNKNQCLYILSNDTGYDCLTDFWQEYNVKRITDFSPCAEKNKPSEKEMAENTASKKEKTRVSPKDIKTVINNEDTAVLVSKIINGSSSKNEVSIKLSRHYRNSKKASEIYNNIKGFLKNMK